MDLRSDEIPDHWKDLVVDIQVRGQKLFLASSLGNMIEVDSDYFVDEPREAIAFADMLAMTPKLFEYVREQVQQGCGAAQKVWSECFDEKE